MPRLQRWKSIYLTVDELDVLGALRVAVTGTVLGTSLVVSELAGTTIGVHLNQVDCTVETTRKSGHVDVESELLVLEVEELVGGVVLREEVDTGTDVLRVRALGHELERELVAAGGDTVGTCDGIRQPLVTIHVD